MGHARALVTLADPKLQVKIFEEIIEHGYSVRKVEELVKSLKGRKAKPCSMIFFEYLHLQLRMS